jgi:hypothetical protein
MRINTSYLLHICVIFCILAIINLKFYIMESIEGATIQAIKNNEVYKAILKDSYGGVMYTLGTQKKYNSTEIVELWESLSKKLQESSGGIMKGLFDFLQEKEV